MANVLHSSLTGAELHEPKGANAASQDTVYVANGSGSGAWTEHHTWCETASLSHSRNTNAVGTYYSSPLTLAKIPWNATVDAISINGTFNGNGNSPSMGVQVYNSTGSFHKTWVVSPGTGTSTLFEVITDGSITNRNVSANTNTYLRIYIGVSNITFTTVTATVNNLTIWYRQRN